MSQPHRYLRGAALPLVVLAAVLGTAAGVRAASKSVVAVLGDAAPGGGVFVGPGFSGWPSAAGEGWVAFRGHIASGSTTEALVVARMVAPVSRTQVASIGQPAPGGGTFKDFLGRPTVNGHGDVAFLAQVTHSDADDSDSNGPSPAGIFLWHAGALAAVARTGDQTLAGTLDLLAVVDTQADPNDLPERAPALNDAGDVAFVSGIQDNPQASGAVFYVPLGRGPRPLVRIGAPFDGGTFRDLGPPALNNLGKVVFHARVARASEPDGVIDGIFTVGTGPIDMVVRDGQLTALNLPLENFEDPVEVNDRGDVVFMAGPLYDKADVTLPLDGRSPGILVCTEGNIMTVVAYPGRTIGSDQITSFQLGPAAGSALAPPSITPDGRVAFFASLSGGSREAIALWDGSPDFVAVHHTGGFGADVTPAGGVYAATESAAVIDASGGLAFLARIAGGVTSEALIYQPATGTGVPIVVGDAAPNSGFFAGNPFSTPLLNDAGDVVFRAFLARTDASVGLFRSRGGRLDALVRAGDAAPLPGDPAFLDLLGQPSLNQAGAVAFAAQVVDRRIGIFVLDANGVRAVVVSGDSVPGEPNMKFRTLSQNPSLNDRGAVAFRASTLQRDPRTGASIRRDGIFLADGSGIHSLVWTRDPAPGGLPFFALRDPVLTNVQSVAFRAALGDTEAERSGVFVADASGIRSVAAEKDDLGGNVTLSHLSGDPVAAADGSVAFVAVRTRLLQPGLRKTLGPAIFRETASGLTLIVAQDMPGPAGGTFRNLEAPTAGARGHLAFRASFLPLTGGTAGFFLATEMGLEPYLSLGEATPAGGRFASFGARATLNGHDDLAFSATLSRGAARSGIFLASRAQLGVRGLDVRLVHGGRDRVRVRAVLRPGHLSDGFDPEHDPVTVSLTDARGPLWSATVSPAVFKRVGTTSVAVPRKGSALARQLAGLRLQVGRRGTSHVTAVSAPLDLTQAGQRPLEAPFAVTVQVGDDAATRTLPCTPRPHGLHCKLF